MTIRAALVGCGTWGVNLLRVLSSSRRAELVVVADPSPARRRVAATIAPGAIVVPSLTEALAHDIGAVIIAGPPHLHAALTLRALDAGADVFVEKPLAMRAADADRCAARASSLGRVAMVGHILRYHPTVERLVALVGEGAVGLPARVECVRRSVAGDRGCSALWTLGPHDFSVLQAIDASPLAAVAARAGAGGDPVTVEAELTSGLAASIALARAGATKERRIRVVGSEGAIEFDDVAAPDRLLVRGHELRVAWEEPLAREIDHFLRCVEERSTPRTSLDEGAAVVRALAHAEEALGGTLVAGADAVAPALL